MKKKPDKDWRLFHASFCVLLSDSFRFLKAGKEKMINESIREYGNQEALEIGQRIQKLRMEHGVTAVDMSELLGITSNQLSRIENGRTKCKLEHIFALAQMFNCTSDYLLFGKRERRDCDDFVQITKEQWEAVRKMVSVFG